MADTVASNVIFKGSQRYAVQITNISDGTGESGVTKVDISTLTGPQNVAPTAVTLEEVLWNVQGFTSVRLYWDHTTDDVMKVLNASGYHDYTKVGGLKDPRSPGGTGDVLLTTSGAASGATYDITLVFRLES